jgi:hypothetical protein
MTALARTYSNIDSRSILPPRVVAEFGLNSVKPPPDMIEEEILKLKNQKLPRLAKATQNKT